MRGIQTRTTGKIAMFPSIPVCVWGTLYQKSSRLFSYPSIPVCTGNPVKNSLTLQLTALNPRVYGEPRHLVCKNLVVYPQSPCVRGTHSSFKGFSAGEPSIPVCTGNPIYTSVIKQEYPLNPRVYGEPNSEKYHVRRFYPSIPVCTGNPLMITYCKYNNYMSIKKVPQH